MTVRAHCSRWMSAAVFSLAALCGAAQADSALDAALAGEHRSEANRARDVYRHPVETLGFFGIKPDMTVVEIMPGGALENLEPGAEIEDTQGSVSLVSASASCTIGIGG